VQLLGYLGRWLFLEKGSLFHHHPRTDHTESYYVTYTVEFHRRTSSHAYRMKAIALYLYILHARSRPHSLLIWSLLISKKRKVTSLSCRLQASSDSTLYNAIDFKAIVIPKRIVLGILFAENVEKISPPVVRNPTFVLVQLQGLWL